MKITERGKKNGKRLISVRKLGSTHGARVGESDGESVGVFVGSRVG